MTPLVDIEVDSERLCPAGMLGDDHLGAAFVQVCNDRVGVESFIGNQTAKLDVFDQGSNADGVVTLAWQEDKADQTWVGRQRRPPAIFIKYVNQ